MPTMPQLMSLIECKMHSSSPSFPDPWQQF